MPHKLVKKVVVSTFQKNNVALHKIRMICCYNGLNEICVGLPPLSGRHGFKPFVLFLEGHVSKH